MGATNNNKVDIAFWFIILLSGAAVGSAYYLDLKGLLSNANGGSFFEDSKMISLALCISFFTCLLIVLKIFGFLTISSKNNLGRKEIRKQLKYQDYLIDLISSHEVDEIFAKKRVMHNFLTKDDFYDKHNRRLLLNEIKAMHKVLAGKKKDKLRKLYLSLGYIEDVKDKLLSINWDSRVEAILEIKQFDLELYYHLIDKFLADKNENVRKNALDVSIQINDQPLSLMEKIPYPLTRWEKHLFLKTLSTLPISQIPDLSVYYSNHQDHNEFIDEMRSHFNQIEVASKSKLYAI